MEQRRLRLGDTLDDYCPRERRVTNHAVVAMIEDTIKQTRCTTCDAEHPYKGAKVPRRRKAETPAALFREVLAGMPDTEAVPVLTAPAPQVPPPLPVPTVSGVASHLANSLVVVGPDASAKMINARATIDTKGTIADETDDDDRVSPEPDKDRPEDGPVHRALIRATLPRLEGHKDERRPTDFTIRQPGGRTNGPFRGGDPRMKSRPGSGGSGATGHRPPHGGPRFAGARPAGPGRGAPGRGGPPTGFRDGQGQSRQGGGRKRSR